MGGASPSAALRSQTTFPAASAGFRARPGLAVLEASSPAGSNKHETEPAALQPSGVRHPPALNNNKQTL